ncbi:hypothetical protein CTEN210_08208 [Chaetoceros tenuissimus]|uniref:Uncharacterized protein n=1 Tax=Chaetoceros tenuissimus TaxID=426638 RepID=A0AAD3CT52_9STRA|nr:hypothetical protein CTEN210_08208 [Chaetoceros tenuissimus]
MEYTTDKTVSSSNETKDTQDKLLRLKNEKLLKLLLQRNELPKAFKESLEHRGTMMYEKVVQMSEIHFREKDGNDPSHHFGGASSMCEKISFLLTDYHSLPREIKEELDDMADFFYGDCAIKAGTFLHKLDDTKISECQVETLIECLPEALSCTKTLVDYEGDGDQIEHYPIQSTCFRDSRFGYTVDIMNSISFIPLLAREGMKSQDKILKDSRAGLLFGHDCFGNNCLQSIIRSSYARNPLNYRRSSFDQMEAFDKKCVQVLKRLKDLHLLNVDDVQEQKLLTFSESNELESSQGCMQYRSRLHYLFSLDQPSLKLTLHKFIPYGLDIVISAAFIHFPHEGALLFLQDEEGESTIDKACKIYGNDEAWDTILRSFNEVKVDSTLPQFSIDMDNFSIGIEDDTLASLNMSKIHDAFQNHGVTRVWRVLKDCLDRISAAALMRKHVNTNLFPFMSAAIGNHSDLNMTYYLLRKDAMVVISECGLCNKGLKRKRIDEE